MHYAFLRSESVPRGIRRIASEQLNLAISELRDAELPHEKAIHETRKHLKMVRGMLRLVRSGTSSKLRQETTEFRHLASRLSGCRDADIMQRTCEAIRQRCTGNLDLSAVEARIQMFRAELIRQGEVPDRLRLETADGLEKRLRRVSNWTVTGNAEEVLFEGLASTFRKGRNGLKVARETAADDNLHEWRKACKQHWYQIRLLKKSWPEELGHRATILSHLCDDLGLDHDLAVLGDKMFATEHPVQFDDSKQFTRTLKEWRRELQQRAFRIGSRLYAESPKCLARRLILYWRCWKTAEFDGDD